MHSSQDANVYIVSVSDKSEITFESIGKFNEIFTKFI